jgi:hypothetical protein
MEVMKLHQRPHIMYSEDQKRLKLTYKSETQNLLAIIRKGEKGETVTAAVCVSASGSNRILPMVLCGESTEGFEFKLLCYCVTVLCCWYSCFRNKFLFL